MVHVSLRKAVILWEQKTWRGGGWRHSVIGVLDVEGKKKALEGEEKLYGNKGALKIALCPTLGHSVPY